MGVSESQDPLKCAPALGDMVLALRTNLADRLSRTIGTGLYSGYFPIAPGTVGSGVGLAIFLGLGRLGVLSEGSAAAWLAAVGAVFLAGLFAARSCERQFGPDNKRIVVDEIWGMLVAVFMLPPSLGYGLAGFFLFRIFDIVKPPPARRAERVDRGLGVMLDDGIAGAYAAVLLHAYRLIWG